MTVVVEQTRRPVRTGRMTALVAVRHPAARESAVRILRGLGASDVLAASTVEQARRAGAGRPGELCVVEAGLCEGSGISLARELRLAGWGRTIVLSTSEDPYTVRAALEAGVRCYLRTAAGAAPVAASPLSATAQGLSHREIEVLQLVADGCSNRDVGDALGLSALTVKSHLARIARKLGTGDRAELVIIALRAGVID